MSTATKPWWMEHQDELQQELDEDQSFSASTRKALGEWGYATEAASVGANPEHEALERASRKLARTVNVMLNSADGKEVNLSLGWSDGKKSNTPKDHTVWLSPDAVLDADKKGGDIAIDALTGQALLASTMKRTIHRGAWMDAQEDTNPGAQCSRTIWQAMETAAARAEVLDQCPGFSPYFARHERQSCASLEQVQQALDTSPPSLELAAAALSWQLLHPHDPLTLPKPYVKGITRALDSLARDIKPKSRYKAATEAAGLLEIEPVPPPPQPPQPSDDGEESKDKQKQPGEGEGKGESEPKEEGKDESDKPDDKPDDKEGEPKGDGEGKEQDKDEPKDEEKPNENEGEPKDKSEDKSDDKEGDKGEDKGNDQPGKNQGEGESESESEPEPPTEPQSAEGPAGPPPKITDDILFGEKIESDCTSVPEPVNFSQVSGVDMEITLPSGCCDITGYHVTSIRETDPTAYNEATRRLQTYIKAISEALRFRNNDPTQYIRGCPSGDLDEGSLDKLSFNESNPNIWERRELHGQPKVAVGLLLDESGSMGGDKIDAARDITIALAAALARIRGVSLMVLGHTANSDDTWLQHREYYRSSWCDATRKEYLSAKPVDYAYSIVTRYRWALSDTASGKLHPKHARGECYIHEYYTKDHANAYALPLSSAFNNNLDGHAMDYAVRKMMADYPSHTRRILFVISDGQPAGSGKGGRGYGSTEANQHMRRVCEFGRRNQVGVYGIGICNAYKQSEADEMYGPGNAVVIKDVMSSLPILTAYLRQVAARPT